MPYFWAKHKYYEIENKSIFCFDAVLQFVQRAFGTNEH